MRPATRPIQNLVAANRTKSARGVSSAPSLELRFLARLAEARDAPRGRGAHRVCPLRLFLRMNRTAPQRSTERVAEADTGRWCCEPCATTWLRHLRLRKQPPTRARRHAHWLADGPGARTGRETSRDPPSASRAARSRVGHECTPLGSPCAVGGRCPATPPTEGLRRSEPRVFQGPARRFLLGRGGESARPVAGCLRDAPRAGAVE